MTATPGVYAGVPMAEYLDLAACSASVLKTMNDECPFAARHTSFLNPNRKRETNDVSDAGSIAHSILLEGSDALCEVIDPKDYPGLTKPYNIPDGWTNKPIKEARDFARAEGKIPVLIGDMALIRGMVDSARAFLNSDELKRDEPAIWRAFQPDGGDSELTCLWDDDGTLCRMRPDRISADRGVIIDPKFTKRAAEPDSWGRTQMGMMGYRISAALYRRGAQALFGTLPDYVFLVVEQEPPHLCSLIGVDPPGLALGEEQVGYGLAMWKQCVASGHWPAYPTRVCYPETPPWEQTRLMEKQGVGRDGIPYDLSKLFERTDA